MKTLIALLSLTAVVCVAPAFGGVTLGTAETFAVLGATTVTNTGATKIRGNLGVSPGTEVAGFPPGKMQLGTINAGNAVAAQAQADLANAYNSVVAKPCTFNLTGQDLGGLTLTPGVYCFDSSAQLTGTLVLDFQKGSTEGFIFQIGSTLTTASSSTVTLQNCTKICPIVWQVGSSATLGTDTTFSGNILAKVSITLTTGVNICGRALAETGAVTMDTDIVFFMGSLTPLAPSMVTGNVQIAVPEPNSTDPAATGTGKAGLAFVADPTGKGTFFSYLNYATGFRVYGPVDNVEVIATHPDGSPATVRISGVCHASLPQCSFSATVEKSDAPGEADRLGVMIAGGLGEARSSRYTGAGQIQFH
jgi:type VI secretion system secreted protein VgrG